jgi:hypothetical protein
MLAGGRAGGGEGGREPRSGGGKRRGVREVEGGVVGGSCADEMSGNCAVGVSGKRAVPLRVGRGASKTPIVLEAVWNRGVTVAADEARYEGGAPQQVSDRADVEAGQALLLAES